MKTHRSTWNKADKREAHKLKQEVRARFATLTAHCLEQFTKKTDNGKTAFATAKRVLQDGLVVEVHDINRLREIRVVIRLNCDVFSFVLVSGLAVTYWFNHLEDNHSTLRCEQITHRHLLDV